MNKRPVHGREVRKHLLEETRHRPKSEIKRDEKKKFQEMKNGWRLMGLGGGGQVQSNWSAACWNRKTQMIRKEKENPLLLNQLHKLQTKAIILEKRTSEILQRQ